MSDQQQIVVLDRIEPGTKPNYCTHGRATCMGGCGEWVWLGHQTFKIVSAKEAVPLCRQCAATVLAHPANADAKRLGNAGDDVPHA